MNEENLSKTKYNKIFVAEPLFITKEQIDEKINILKDIISNENISTQEVKKVIGQLVDTYIET